MKTVSFYTLGCKVNQYDSQAMLELFEQDGYIASTDGNADVYVVNTCTVTGTGDKKSMQLIRRCRRKNPNAELIIAGCLAQRQGEKLLETGARLIIGTQHRTEVVKLFKEAMEKQVQTVAVENVEHVPYEPMLIHNHEGYTRAVMKIQEGCDNRCTYCIIPSVRGGIRSRAMESIREEAFGLADAGFVELVLTGVHLTSYGRDLPNKPDLAQAVLCACEPDRVLRVRIGSLEPRVATQRFVDTLKNQIKVCPQFHLALQSGSDTVLQRMKRGYNTTQFWEAVLRIREAWPDAALTTDVIVGFPGETEEEFSETLAFCEKVGFARLHVFPYSKREGTPAAGMSAQISESIKTERVHRLIALGERLAKAYQERFIGRVVPVLLEERSSEGFLLGYTPEYIPVRVQGGEAGSVYPVRLTGIESEGMIGTLCECPENNEIGVL